MLSYRAPTAGEAEAMARLHVVCWREAYAGLLGDGYLADLSIATRADLWRRVIPDQALFKLAAFEADQPVGFVISGPARDPASRFGAGEILALYLRRNFQGQGIGRQLFNRAGEDWNARGGGSLVAMVIAGNQRGRQFYSRMGAAEVGEIGFELGGQTLTEIACVFLAAPPSG